MTFAAAPVGAGQACQRLGLDSPCIKSNDLKARILRAWSSRSAISADSAALGCWRARPGVCYDDGHQARGESAAARSYTVLLQPEPEGGNTVTCPTLPGLVTYGETLEEACAMASDVIRGYTECLREDGEPIPESDPATAPLADRVSVKAG